MPETRPSGVPAIRAADRAYALLLRLYPRDFRRRYGEEARGLFRSRYREEYVTAGWSGLVRYAFRTVGNVFIHGILERWNHDAPRKREGQLSSVISDVKYAARTLRRNPAFAGAAVLALALGIGANTAIFSLIDGVLLRSLPYADVHRLMVLATDPTEATGGAPQGIAPADLVEWRRGNEVFDAIAAHRNSSLGFTALETPLVPLTLQVTTNYFDVLRVEPLLGRTFRPEDATPGSRVVLISHRVWQSALNADPSIVGSEIELDDEAWTVIGVLRADFYSSSVLAVQPDLWVPYDFSFEADNRVTRSMLGFGRLREGVTVDEARDNMRAVAARIGRDFPATNAGWSVLVTPIREWVLGSVQQLFVVLLAAVGFVLLIACANVANLILARSAERSREVALRIALGAGRGRLARQLVVESVLLSSIAGVAAMAVSVWAVEGLLALIPADTGLPFVDDVRIDGSVLAFGFALSLVTGVVCALAPALHTTRADVAASMKAGARTQTSSRGGRRLRNGLVVAEFALSLTLLFGASLMLQTFVGLRGYEAGFDAERLLHLRTSLRGKYRTSTDDVKSYFAELTRRLEALPGVESVSGVSAAPPIVPFLGTTFRLPGTAPEPGREPSAADRRVLPRYFETMGIALLRGRLFDGRDVDGGAPVAIVNQAFAQRYFADSDLESMSLILPDGVERRIVGVVGNVRAGGADPTPPPVLYTPYDQRPIPIMTLMVRSASDPALLASAAEETAWGMGTDMNVYNVTPMAALLDSDAWRQRFIAQLIGAFALLALVLGAAGIYSVLTYTVTERTHEIGIRRALGAGRGSVIGMVLGDGLRLAFIGAIIGLAGAFVIGRVVSNLLYDVSPTDPTSLATVAAVLFAVAVAACLVPALRATRVDPLRALQAS